MGYTEIPGRLLTVIFLLAALNTQAQEDPGSESRPADLPAADDSSAPDYRKLHGIFAVQSVVYVGTLYALSKSWYKNPLTHFHFRDDRHVWMQMDKFGHLFTAYQISRYTSEIYGSTGISRKQRILYGALSGFVFQSPIELLDGFSPDYGFSPSDVVANLAGSALFAGQMLAWDELRIVPKFSVRPTSYAGLRPELLGRTAMERLLKDYNGQTYWFSASPGSFFPRPGWPRWLCISVGYGIENMIAAETGKSISAGYRPYRQYYLSLDIDFTKIPAKRKWVRTAALLLNTLKVPAPALELSTGRLHFHPVCF